MNVKRRLLWSLLLWGALILMGGCSERNGDGNAPVTQPTPTSTPPAATPPAEGGPAELAFITVATDAPSRTPNFATIDEFGTVVGFDADIMGAVAVAGDFEYEFVVTSFDGLLATVAAGEFDAAMAALLMPDEPVAGIQFTDPYLEVGQVLVVRANEQNLQSHRDVQAGTRIGVQAFSSGEQTALEVMGMAAEELVLFESVPQALQELYNGAVDGVILDSDDAAQYTAQYPQALKVAGGAGQEAWISGKAYAMAVAADNSALLAKLNQAIAEIHSAGTVDQLTRLWLVAHESIAATESLVGTPPDELVIGILGNVASMDPAASREIVSWEVKVNTMSGLLMLDADNRLIPALAADFPLISENRLEYTFTLRPGLLFPDGSELTAEDVVRSIRRAVRYPNFIVNDVLKDADGNGTADDDAAQALDSLTVKFVLAAPTGYFLNMLATPPFFTVNEACEASNFDPAAGCGGIGPYQVTAWEPAVQMRLEANPRWPGQPPAFDKILLRFYDDPARMRRSLENSAIDLAWTGLPAADIAELRSQPGYTAWESPPVFKSYLVFEQSAEPWDDVRVRLAAAYAVDRQHLASVVFNSVRQPLRSPVPTSIPGHMATEPERDLERARILLAGAGFSPENPVETTLWYLNDGRYTPLEEAYATAIKAQLEETGIFRITLRGEPWNFFIGQVSTCNAPAFLLGWPPSGSPARFLDAMDWMEYFITNTATVCSNYESEAMTALYDAARAAAGESERLAAYAAIQALWAEEIPTLDLTQAPVTAMSLTTVSGVRIDAMGFLHYYLLTKGN